MLGKLFKKKGSNEIELFAPVDGEIVPLEEVPDPVFSEQMMGDGIAIKPFNGKVISPVDGDIVQVFPTKHAVGVKAGNGAEILIHIGLETVALDGEGFTVRVKEGDKVKKGDPLVDIDLAVVSEKASSTVTPMLITNMNDIETLDKQDVKQVRASEDVVITIK
ncbi:putative phosphotransferase enzyme IIA component YpqE [Oceanobacillus oncorhynchi subsp. incaldanensis]|uniref:PTS sugar transporter subunit IIA n=1 Tax=Oceanobacillus oncorhynchi TaxID=545501 RepID=UPI001B21EFC2|nr:PTS glucose transporter subunit IIA [Oceanobacillus oncorhynchi]GIO18866.1 putative phosphotransferase enzyme IIA component YpqE [Oceanobacillus oncorhynchi subsp. incaldanensis]